MTVARPSDQEVADICQREKYGRELSRRRLDWYWRRMNPRHTPGAWQLDLCRRLQRFTEQVIRRESPMLMVFAPPQRGKSITVSRTFPAWLLGNHPDWPIILGSYGKALPAGHGAWIRNALTGMRHMNVFPRPECRLATDSKAKDEFQTLAGGQFLARGVGGGTTGQPARVFIVDDPYADRQEAESPVGRKNVWDWYWSVVDTRMAPGGGQLLMNTRWHEDDLCGALIEHGKANPEGGQFEVVSYPEVAEEGDILGRSMGQVLFPERYTPAMVKAKKARTPSRDWLSMYQQRPSGGEGSYFKVGLINRIQGLAVPKLERVYQAWDLALSVKTTADESVGATLGIDHLNRHWLLDLIYGQWSPEECARRMVRFWQKWEAQRVWLEGGPPFLGVEPSLKTEMKNSGIWIPYEEVSHGGKSKDVRAISIRGIVNGGNLYVPWDAPWWKDFEHELAGFPNGKRDNKVDAIAYLGLKVGQMLPNADRTVAQKVHPVVERSQMVKRTYAALVKQQREPKGDRDDW